MHEEEALLAIEAIEEHGRQAYLIPKNAGGGAWNSSTDDATPIPVTVLQTGMVQAEVDGQKVFATDFRYLVDSQQIVDRSMKLRDVVNGDTIDLEIGFVAPVKPGETLIIQKIYARL